MEKSVALALLMSAFVSNCLAMPPVGTSKCQTTNDVADKDVTMYNAAVINSHEATADIATFLQDFQMTLLWFTLPMKTNVYAYDGLLTLGNMTRAGDVITCSNSSIQTLQGVFDYDEFRVSYALTAKFFMWETEGKFSCSIKHPRINVLYSKNDVFGCRISSLNLNNSGKRQCKVTPDNSSWSAWLVGKAVHYSLLSTQPSPDSMLGSFLQASYSTIDINFGKSWCSAV